jgi:hypothetical protein
MVVVQLHMQMPVQLVTVVVTHHLALLLPMEVAVEVLLQREEALLVKMVAMVVVVLFLRQQRLSHLALQIRLLKPMLLLFMVIVVVTHITQLRLAFKQVVVAAVQVPLVETELTVLVEMEGMVLVAQ